MYPLLSPVRRKQNNVYAQVRQHNDSIFHCWKTHKQSLMTNHYGCIHFYLIYIKVPFVSVLKCSASGMCLYNIRGAFHRLKSKHDVSILIITREIGVAIPTIIFQRENVIAQSGTGNNLFFSSVVREE